MQKKSRSRILRDNAFKNVNMAEPKRVQVTRKRHGNAAAESMKRAIALDDARSHGARISKKRT